MGELHEATRALLEAADAWRTTGEVLDAVGGWRAAGRPDLDPPEPDRLTPAEGLDALDRLLSDPRLTASAIMRLTDRIKALESDNSTLRSHYEAALVEVVALGSCVEALERLTAPPAPPPEPARFVPTEPGYYWRNGRNGPEPVKVADAGTTWLGFRGLTEPVKDDGLWLAPVAPYAPPTRTEEEARREPRRGDRWLMPEGDHYTLTYPLCGTWYAVTRDGHVPCHRIGEPHETYLGNFAHELEAP